MDPSIYPPYASYYYQHNSIYLTHNSKNYPHKIVDQSQKFSSGTLIHNRWAAYFAYDLCKHQVCGSHLLRNLTLIVDFNNYCWARLMKKLLCECSDEINKSEAGVLSKAECRRYRKRYRTILTQGGKEMPGISQRREGQRGRIAKSSRTTCTRPC